MENFKNKYIWIGIPYLFCIGVLYLWGYWNNFNINIFEYASIADLLKVSIIPVSSIFIFTIFGAIFVVARSKNKHKSRQKNSKFIRVIDKLVPFAIMLYFSVFPFLVFFDSANKWLLAPVLFFIFPFGVLVTSNIFSEIENSDLRVTIIAAICLLPFYSFCTGLLNADLIIKNKEYKYAVLFENKENYKFLGHAGDFNFFASINNKVVIIQKTSENPLILNMYREPNAINEKNNPSSKP